MTVKELYYRLKEYEKTLKQFHDIDSRIATEDNIHKDYYGLRDLLKEHLEKIGDIKIG